ncbi:MULTISPECIES: carboxylesterase/lipase family protein [Terrabacteria group]|uniref:carboxylesterase/lipase family protein n=1 Tax=Bacillati TaxID=1783272 RepID=UPI00193A6CE2|nr:MULTISPECIES: carboxylesterase family protein [Terrabacteria group]MBW9212867.1 carboxylesterase family protein [Trueperella sp. zg.1013]QRG86471.1 carboxylesterase family protein [Bulleidia sp. zg-1006]
MKTIDIKVEQGILRGEQKGSQMIFKGIPYAKPPIQDNRFKSPQAMSHWIGVRDALEFGPICPQMDLKKLEIYGKEFYAGEQPKQSEDCLYLNIWAPTDYQGKKYPVVLWIHGGSFDHGYGFELPMDGKNYAIREVILVTMNYRVGAFGFMASPELTRDDPLHSISNLGLLDMISALRWVRRNIDAFGGDSDRITLMGQSAGAIACQILLASPLTRGMVSSVILQSGAGINDGMKRLQTKQEAYKTGKKMMDLLKVHNLKELRKVSTQKILATYEKLYGEDNELVFLPTLDHLVIEKELDEAFTKQEIMNVPILIGMTDDDLGVKEGKGAKSSFLYEGILNLVETRKDQEPVYMYIFKKKLPGDEVGAFHSSELWFTFGTLEKCWRPFDRRDYRLRDVILDQWTNFIKKGNPEGGWKAYRQDEPFIRVIV